MADSTIRLLPSLWGRCDVHGVLVKVGTQCSACVGDGEGKNLKLRTEHFEIGEPQPGWTVEITGKAS